MFFAPPGNAGSVVVLIIVCRHRTVTITTVAVTK